MANQEQEQEQEYSEAKASAASAAPATPLTAKERVWLLGPPLLGEKARGLLGKLAGTYTDDVLAEVLAQATVEKPIEPKAWVTAACEARAKKPKTNGRHVETADLLSDPEPEWATGAGFPDRFQAENAGCGPGNWRQFRNGQRVAAA